MAGVKRPSSVVVAELCNQITPRLEKMEKHWKKISPKSRAIVISAVETALGRLEALQDAGNKVDLSKTEETDPTV